MNAPPPAAPRLVAIDLACRRGDRLLFKGLGFELDAGEAMQIAGPNGIGKTSLLRIAAGLLRPFAGHVEHSGAVALIDERLALDEHQPLGKALDLWSALDGGATDAGRFGLNDLLDVPVRYLSTGQRKRAALARLVAQQAPIWLLDEPLNGLDTNAVDLVQALTAEHCAAGGVALIASHQPFALAVMKQVVLAEFAQ